MDDEFYGDEMGDNGVITAVSFYVNKETEYNKDTQRFAETGKFRVSASKTVRVGKVLTTTAVNEVVDSEADAAALGREVLRDVL